MSAKCQVIDEWCWYHINYKSRNFGIILKERLFNNFMAKVEVVRQGGNIGNEPGFSAGAQNMAKRENMGLGQREKEALIFGTLRKIFSTGGPSEIKGGNTRFDEKRDGWVVEQIYFGLRHEVALLWKKGGGSAEVVPLSKTEKSVDNEGRVLPNKVAPTALEQTLKIIGEKGKMPEGIGLKIVQSSGLNDVSAGVETSSNKVFEGEVPFVELSNFLLKEAGKRYPDDVAISQEITKGLNLIREEGPDRKAPEEKIVYNAS